MRKVTQTVDIRVLLRISFDRANETPLRRVLIGPDNQSCPGHKKFASTKTKKKLSSFTRKSPVCIVKCPVGRSNVRSMVKNDHFSVPISEEQRFLHKPPNESFEVGFDF